MIGKVWLAAAVLIERMIATAAATPINLGVQEGIFIKMDAFHQLMHNILYQKHVD